MDEQLNDKISEFLGINGSLYCNKPENSYDYSRDFAVNIQRAAQKADNEWMEEIIYPKIELIFHKHDGEPFTYTLLDTINQELNRLKEQIIESTSNDYMAKFVFDDCVIRKLRILFLDSYYFHIVRSHLLQDDDDVDYGIDDDIERESEE